MKCIFICQEVDLAHPVQATAVNWIREFAEHPDIERVFVVTLRSGEFSLPDNVTVYPIQKRHRLGTILEFYAALIRLLRSHKIDFFWVNQGGPYPALLLPLKLLLRKPIYHWKAHPYIGPAMGFYARYCDTKIFTCTMHSFPMDLPKVHVIGHGIDTMQFRPLELKKDGDLVTIGRIAPSKSLHEMLEMLKKCREDYDARYSLDIYGAVFENDRTYKKTLEQRIEEYDLSDLVSFKGEIRHDQLPETLNRYRVLLNFSNTALDKAVVEAMACALPVMTSNSCAAEIVPKEFASALVVPRKDPQKQAESLHVLLSKSHVERTVLGERLRDVAVRQHSVRGLITRIMTIVGTPQ